MKQSFFMFLRTNFTKQVAFIAIVLICIAPVISKAQDQEDQQVINQPTTDPTSTGNSNGTLSTSPWPNNGSSSSSGIQATQSGEAGGSGAAARPGTNPAQRPVGGGTTLGRDPGGNPDVPFDDTMNLGFLVVGLVFAFVVFKKRMASKAIVAATKK